MCKLFVGFRKLGEFDSILIAKQYAHESGITGAFNLLGTNGYGDSWYVFEKHDNKTTDSMANIENHSITPIEVTDCGKTQ